MKTGKIGYARLNETVALSSGLQRERAHRFYEDYVEMDRASYVFTLDLD